MARPRLHDDALRRRLLERAGRTVAERGIGTLSLRTLAADVGTSTSAVYSLFGGKPELLKALHRWAFAGFGAAQRAVPVTDDPLADLHALGLAYRSWALAHPHLYAVMFGGLLVGVPLDSSAHRESAATMDPLTAVVRRGVQGGLLGHADVDTIAMAVWAGVHGLVSLELAEATDGCVEQRDAFYRAGLHGIARAWRT